MGSKIQLLSIFVFLFSFSGFASEQCEVEKWHELANEKEVIKNSPFVTRIGDALTIKLKNRDVLVFRDGDNEAQVYRVMNVDKNGDWVSIFSNNLESLSYELIHRKDGKREKLHGCLIWSPDGRYFVSLNQDGGSGHSKDEAALWYCHDLDDSCERIWNGDAAGRKAVWRRTSVEIETSKPNPKDVTKDVVKTILCSPDYNQAGCV